MNLLSFFYFQQTIIVDRIEENLAVVEWENEHLSLIPLDEFTTAPKEGDIYLFQLYRFSKTQCLLQQNDPILIHCNDFSIVVPDELQWREESRLKWTLKPTLSKAILNQ